MTRFHYFFMAFFILLGFITGIGASALAAGPHHASPPAVPSLCRHQATTAQQTLKDWQRREAATERAVAVGLRGDRSRFMAALASTPAIPAPVRLSACVGER